MKLEKRIHPRIEDSITSLLQPLEQFFYHFFLARVEFFEALTGLPTMCATIINMRLAICWNREFVDELDDKELRFLMFHEMFHLLHHHLERGKNYHPEKANIAMDMIINELIMKHYHKTRSGYVMSEMPVFSHDKIEEMVAKIKSMRELSSEDETDIRKMEGKATGCTLDPNYKGPLAFEPLYDWLMEQHDKSKQCQPNELSDDTRRMLDNADIKDMMMDAHMRLDEVSEDIKKQLVEEGVAKSRLECSKTRGSVAGDVEDVLAMLLKAPKNNNLKLVKRSISSLKGKVKEKTWKRINRRVTGLKGRHGTGNQINVILDVSGSMFGSFEKVLREIYRDGFEINLIEADTRVTHTMKIKDKSQLQRFAIKGGGGTELNPAIEYVVDPHNGLSKFGTVILTDGFCGTFDFKGSMGSWLILTTDAIVPHNGGDRVKQVKIEA